MEKHSLSWAVLLPTVTMKRNDQGKVSWEQNAKDLTVAKTVSQKWVCLTGPIEWSGAYSPELSHSRCLSFFLFSKQEFLCGYSLFLYYGILDGLEVVKLVSLPKGSESWVPCLPKTLGLLDPLLKGGVRGVYLWLPVDSLLYVGSSLNIINKRRVYVDVYTLESHGENCSVWGGQSWICPNHRNWFKMEPKPDPPKLLSRFFLLSGGFFFPLWLYIGIIS